jgi:prephenate dehydrogenase
MQQISIIGFGRFGRTLYSLLNDDFSVVLYNRSDIQPDTVELTENTTISKNLEDVYTSDVIFYAVPISQFETVIKGHQQYFEPRHLLIDVLSVKLWPAKVLSKYLTNSQAQALLTHPMFGPDSSRQGFKDLPIIIDKFMADDKNYRFWMEYFTSKGLQVLEMSANEHDKMAANSQGLTHFIGRLLDQYGLEDTTIDTMGAKKLLEIKTQTCNDSWQLFNDLQHFNPYTKKMRLKLGDAYDLVYNKLLPEQIDPNYLTIGIQGGKGSFNEEAVMY